MWCRSGAHRPARKPTRKPYAQQTLHVTYYVTCKVWANRRGWGMATSAGPIKPHLTARGKLWGAALRRDGMQGRRWEAPHGLIAA